MYRFDHNRLDEAFRKRQTPGDDPAVSSDGDRPAVGPPSRRQFLLMSLGVMLAGCSTQQTTTNLPGPTWRVRQLPAPPPTIDPYPAPGASTAAIDGPVIPRALWSPNTAIPSRMKPLGDVRFITVHHDGIGPFFDFDERSTRQRMASILRFHVNTHKWGDIGYHYIVDRNGRVWEGRSLQYQGAHVRNHNENNIGVLLLGNFEQQSPSDRQLEAMQQHVSLLMRRYNVPISRVTTHREWETANTICPGHTLQVHMDRVRRRGQLG
jgi:hypothetical protein